MEAVKRDNNNIFDFMESEGYIRCKADASISSKGFHEIYRMWCKENSLAPLKARSFSDAMIANAWGDSIWNIATTSPTLPDGGCGDLWVWKLWQDLI